MPIFLFYFFPSDATRIQLPKRSPLPFFKFKIIFKRYGMYFYKYRGFVTNQKTDEANDRILLESAQSSWKSLFRSATAI